MFIMLYLIINEKISYRLKDDFLKKVYISRISAETIFFQLELQKLQRQMCRIN